MITVHTTPPPSTIIYSSTCFDLWGRFCKSYPRGKVQPFTASLLGRCAYERDQEGREEEEAEPLESEMVIRVVSNLTDDCSSIEVTRVIAWHYSYWSDSTLAPVSRVAEPVSDFRRITYL